MAWQDKAKNVMSSVVSCFGETAYYTPIDNDEAGTSIQVPVVFNEQYQTVDANEFAVMSKRPNILVKAASFGARKPATGDIFNIRDVDYYCDEIQDDGEAGIFILLNTKDS